MAIVNHFEKVVIRKSYKLFFLEMCIGLKAVSLQFSIIEISICRAVSFVELQAP